VVIRLVQELFEEEGKKFRLIVNGEGEILEVEMLGNNIINLGERHPASKPFS
jgi:hypothetical protein